MRVSIAGCGLHFPLEFLYREPSEGLTSPPTGPDPSSGLLPPTSDLGELAAPCMLDFNSFYHRQRYPLVIEVKILSLNVSPVLGRGHVFEKDTQKRLSKGG